MGKNNETVCRVCSDGVLINRSQQPRGLAPEDISILQRLPF
jgi:hypothetical protein